MRTSYQIINNRLVSAEPDQGHIHVFINPTEEEKKCLVDVYQFDEHTLNSSLDADELPRFEFEPNHIAFIFKRPKTYASQETPLLFTVISIGIFLMTDQLFVLTTDDTPYFNTKHFNRVTSLKDVALRLITSSIFHFVEHLKVINMLSDEIEKKISTSTGNKYLLNQFTLGKSLVFYQNAIHANGGLLEKMKLNAAKLNFTTEEMELLDDIIIENNQCYKQAEIYSNILASLMDAKASIISNNLNVLMKTLNIITISIMVPTFVVSAFSMNVKIPLSSHPQAFVIVMSLAMISVVGFLFFWRFKKW